MAPRFVPQNDPKAVALVELRKAQQSAVISNKNVPTSSDDCSTLLGMWIFGLLILIQTAFQYV